MLWINPSLVCSAHYVDGAESRFVVIFLVILCVYFTTWTVVWFRIDLRKNCRVELSVYNVRRKKYLG